MWRVSDIWSIIPSLAVKEVANRNSKQKHWKFLPKRVGDLPEHSTVHSIRELVISIYIS